MPAWLEAGIPDNSHGPLALASIVEHGDHHILVGEITEAHLPKPIGGRPDVAILEIMDLGNNVFYSG